MFTLSGCLKSININGGQIGIILHEVDLCPWCMPYFFGLENYLNWTSDNNQILLCKNNDPGVYLVDIY